MENVKINGDVAFYEDGHLYVNIKNANVKYVSVTTLLSSYQEAFDSDFWSGYKALESLMGDDFTDLGVKTYLLTKKKNDLKISEFTDEAEYLKLKKSIADGYKQKGIESAKYGTKIHSEREERFYQDKLVNPKSLGFPLHDDYFECERNNFDLNRNRAALPEYLVYYNDPDGILNIAGQIDLLIKDGNDLYIYDYKSNEKGIESKAFYDKKKKATKKLLYPVNNLDDTKLNVYTLQLSFYAWMLIQINPEFKIKQLTLIHVDREDNETEIIVDYKKTEVERLIKAHKKKLKISVLKNEL